MKFPAWICLVSLCGMAEVLAEPGAILAAPAVGKPLPGRLFYTPAQRVMLNDARSHKVTALQQSSAPPESAPVSLDGVLTRSDGVATHWVNGQPHVGQPAPHIRSLKPGQTRAQQKVYEPYQLQRANDSTKPTDKSHPSAPDSETTP